MFTRKRVRGSNPLLSAIDIFYYAYKDKKKVKPSSRNWIQRQLTDQYVARAQKEGYKSRAAYKLLQIQEKFQIFKKDTITIDLGAAPGGWSQVAAKLAHSTVANNLVIAVDLLPVHELVGVKTICGNFLDEEVQNLIWKELGDRYVDAVISDMAPNTTGERSTDYLRIMHLCLEAFSFAQKVLKPGGSFVAKVFRGGADNKILKEIKNNFTTVKHFKPPASRQASTEMYLIALGFKNNQPKEL